MQKNQKKRSQAGVPARVFLDPGVRIRYGFEVTGGILT